MGSEIQFQHTTTFAKKWYWPRFSFLKCSSTFNKLSLKNKLNYSVYASCPDTNSHIWFAGPLRAIVVIFMRTWVGSWLLRERERERERNPCFPRILILANQYLWLKLCNILARTGTWTVLNSWIVRWKLWLAQN